MTTGPQGLGLDGWLKKLNEDFAAAREPVASGDSGLSDDFGKLRRLMAIDRRQLAALPNTIVGRAKPGVVRELESVAADYETLLLAGLPVAPLYDAPALHAKIGDTFSMAARAGYVLGDDAAGHRLNRLAAKAYRKAGQEQRAKKCEAETARRTVDAAGDVDGQVRILREEMAALPADDLPAAEKLIDLALLYSQRGDEFEALPLLRQAETILDAKAGPMGGGDLAQALTDSLLGMMKEPAGDQAHAPFGDILSGVMPDGGTAAGGTPIERKMLARNLYEALYRAYSRIYARSDADEARRYEEKANAFDSRAENDAFSQAMLGHLKDSLFKL
jgi:hypothetical protein